MFCAKNVLIIYFPQGLDFFSITPKRFFLLPWTIERKNIFFVSDFIFYCQYLCNKYHSEIGKNGSFFLPNSFKCAKRIRDFGEL